jgi:hypothetical protein
VSTRKDERRFGEGCAMTDISERSDKIRGIVKVVGRGLSRVHRLAIQKVLISEIIY